MANTVPQDALRKLTGTVREHEVSFVNGIVVVVTLSGEEIFRKVAFACPCTQPSSHFYGGSFIWAPAIILFAVSILVNNVTWRIIHGCLHRSRSTSHGCRRGCFYCVSVTGRSLVAPGAWIFISLIDGSYYMCMVSPSPCDPPANSTENKQLIAESQIYAWTFLVFIVLAVLLVLIVSRCMDKFTYVQNKYIEAYQEIEEAKFNDEMRDRATKLAVRNVKEFFDKDIRMKVDWDAISVAPLCDVHWVKKPKVLLKHNRRFRFGGNFPEPFFTPLHKWANDHRRNRPISDEEQMELLSLQMSPSHVGPAPESHEFVYDAGWITPGPAPAPGSPIIFTRNQNNIGDSQERFSSALGSRPASINDLNGVEVPPPRYKEI